MNAQQRKGIHQQAYRQHVEAVRNGDEPGRFMLQKPEGIVPAKNGKSFSFFDTDKSDK